MKAIVLAAALAMACGLGCQMMGHKHEMGSDQAMAGEMHVINHAIAVLEPTAGNQAHGTVRFTQGAGDTVMVVADISGLAPNSIHGFHIHELGDISSPDGASAGGHFNPDGHQHGSPDGEHHAGDMGNIRANEQGNVHVELTLHRVTVGMHPNPILGRSVVLHAKEDDLKTQPSGDSGARIAVGVIGAAK